MGDNSKKLGVLAYLPQLFDAMASAGWTMHDLNMLIEQPWTNTVALEAIRNWSHNLLMPLLIKAFPGSSFRFQSRDDDKLYPIAKTRKFTNWPEGLGTDEIETERIQDDQMNRIIAVEIFRQNKKYWTILVDFSKRSDNGDGKFSGEIEVDIYDHTDEYLSGAELSHIDELFEFLDVTEP